MHFVQPGKIQIATIHDVKRAGFDKQYIEHVESPILPSLMWMNAGIAPRKSSSVCIFTAAVVVRNGAQSNRLKQRSMVVESSA